MKMTLLKLSEEIRKSLGYDFFDADVCVDICDIDNMIGSVAYQNPETVEDYYIEFDIISCDCDDLTSDKNIIEIKEVQTPKKTAVIDEEVEGWGRVIISHIPEFDWYELDLDDEPLQYFESLEEAKGDIPL